MNRFFIILIITLVTSLWFISYVDNVDNPAYIVSGAAIISGLVISLLAFRLSFRHSQTVCIGKAMLLLGLAFVFYSTAESIWFELYISDLDPYPSTADAFYIIYYSLTILFVVTIFNTFIKQKSVIAWILLAVSLSIISVLYYSVSLEYESEHINIGIIFILFSTFIAASSIILAIRLHNRGMKMIWIMIAITMSLNAIGDVWYYILENIGNYSYHVYIDTLWFAGNLLLILVLLSFEWYEKQIAWKTNIKGH